MQITPLYPSRDVTKMERWLHKPFARNFSTDVVVVRDGSVDGFHRHFGQIAEGRDGRLHLIYGYGPVHGLTSARTFRYCNSDDGGATWSAEVEHVAGVAGIDRRSLSMCVTPSGRILIGFVDALVPTAAPTVFKMIKSDDNGASFTYVANLASIAYSYARCYGRIKVVPKAGKAYQLVMTPYHQDSATPTYRVALWRSDDDGNTWDTSGSIISDTTGYTECEIVAVSASVWFAVTRGDGLVLWKTLDAGATWTSLGTIPLTSLDNFVAPSLDRFQYQGRTYILLGYCDRNSDIGVFRIAAASDLLSSAAAFSNAITLATDMVNASGYQSTVTDPNGELYVEGGTAYVEFKEYVGQTYSQVRFVRKNLFDLASAAARSLTVASGAVTVNSSFFEQQIFVDTEAAAATDDLDTISGGYEGQVITVKSGSSSRDVTLKNGTGNLVLEEDFRLNSTSSRIVLRNVNAQWLEVSRTNDHVTSTPALVIASGIVTVPNARPHRAYAIGTEAAAATDDLDTISGGLEGQIVSFMSSSSSQDTTFKDGTGNMALAGDFTLTTTSDTITLVKRGSTWYELDRSDNA